MTVTNIPGEPPAGELDWELTALKRLDHPLAIRMDRCVPHVEAGDAPRAGVWARTPGQDRRAAFFRVVDPAGAQAVADESCRGSQVMGGQGLAGAMKCVRRSSRPARPPRLAPLTLAGRRAPERARNHPRSTRGLRSRGRSSSLISRPSLSMGNATRTKPVPRHVPSDPGAQDVPLLPFMRRRGRARAPPADTPTAGCALPGGYAGSL